MRGGGDVCALLSQRHAHLSSTGTRTAALSAQRKRGVAFAASPALYSHTSDGASAPPGSMPPNTTAVPFSVSAATEPTRGGGCEPNRAGFGAAQQGVSGPSCASENAHAPNTALTLSATAHGSAQYSASSNSRASMLAAKTPSSPPATPAALKRLQRGWRLCTLPAEVWTATAQGSVRAFGHSCVLYVVRNGTPPTVTRAADADVAAQQSRARRIHSVVAR